MSPFCNPLAFIKLSLSLFLSLALFTRRAYYRDGRGMKKLARGPAELGDVTGISGRAFHHGKTTGLIVL